MHVALTTEQEKLQFELREYFAALITPDDRADMEHRGSVEEFDCEYGRNGTWKRLVRQMGADGWLGIGWPVEYGGQGRSTIEQLVFTNEADRAGMPLPTLTLNTVGPTLMRFGSDAQKEFFLPKMLAGECHFGIGYSEPGAGTDLASLTTRALRDGDEYVINGQKMWTSLVPDVDYIWLACRTNPDAPKHKGLSVIIVPTDAPGFSWSPVPTISQTWPTATFYTDIRVPVTNLVGAENEGWGLITSQLNNERVALCPAGPVENMLEAVVAWASTTRLPDGRRVIDQEWVQVHLGRIHAKAELLKLLNWKIAWGEHGAVGPADASATKVFGTGLFLEATRLAMEVIGEEAYVSRDEPGSVLRSQVERLARFSLILTFGGGTNEIQRDIIATMGVGLPHATR